MWRDVKPPTPLLKPIWVHLIKSFLDYTEYKYKNSGIASQGLQIGATQLILYSNQCAGQCITHKKHTYRHGHHRRIISRRCLAACCTIGSLAEHLEYRVHLLKRCVNVLTPLGTYHVGT